MEDSEATSALPALVLTAGLGTRLRPLTDVRAKPAVPVNGEALVLRILRWLAAQGVADAVLNLHHRPETIATAVGDGSGVAVRVRYSWEHPILGSAGGPRHALPLLAPTFLIVNGDTLTDLDLGSLIAAHHAMGAAVTMALIPNPRPDKYGGVRLSDAGYVTGFTRPGTPGASFHFIGVQVVEASAFAALEDGVPSESVNVLYPRLIAENPRAVGGFVADASFTDIGTPGDYLATSLALAGLEGNRLAQGARVVVATSAAVVRTALWDDVTVGAHVRLTDCIVGDGVRVPDGAVHDRCVLVRAGARPPSPDERIVGDLLIRSV